MGIFFAAHNCKFDLQRSVHLQVQGNCSSQRISQGLDKITARQLNLNPRNKMCANWSKANWHQLDHLQNALRVGCVLGKNSTRIYSDPKLQPKPKETATISNRSRSLHFMSRSDHNGLGKGDTSGRIQCAQGNLSTTIPYMKGCVNQAARVET